MGQALGRAAGIDQEAALPVLGSLDQPGVGGTGPGTGPVVALGAAPSHLQREGLALYASVP